jgi:sulfotransferase
MRKFHCVSGLPRAGSTLLCQLLNMNNNFHVTPTSATIDMLKAMRSNFSHDVTWKAQDRMELYDDFRNGLKGFLDGYFADKDVVIDKSRAWPGNLRLLDEIFQNNDTKVIWCYRDPIEVVGSIEAQYQKTLLIENADEHSAPGAFMTLDRRIGTFMNEGGIVHYPVEILRDAFEMGYGDRILIIKYYDLTNNTQLVLDDIHDFLGEPRVTYDFKQLKQSTFEYDGFYNYKFLHTIKEGDVKYKKSDVVLPTKYAQVINEKYAGLNRLVFDGKPDMFLGLSEEQYKEQQLTLKLK